MKLHSILKIYFQDYLKKEYDKELIKLDKNELNKTEIKTFLNNILKNNEDCKNYIYECLENSEQNITDEDKKEINDIMEEMIDDSDLIMNRIIVEIEAQQVSKNLGKKVVNKVKTIAKNTIDTAKKVLNKNKE